MGKSDAIIFEEYRKILRGIAANSVAFLGFPQENALTMSMNIPVKHFYDLSIDNWNINSPWSLKQSYDLIVCTRCAYFSKEPSDFIERIKNHLNKGGHALIDWGLGDHWRFTNYKVGWLRNGEHEFAYTPNNFLHSCLWKESFLQEGEVQNFWINIKGKFEYDNDASLDFIVRQEVPKVVEYDYKKISFKTLWPDSPQLYIITLVEK